MLRTLTLVVAVTVNACSKAPAASASPAASQAPAPAATSGQAAPAQPQTGVKPVPAQLPEVVARVNGEPINRAEFEKAIQNVEGRVGGPVPEAQRDRVYRGVLDQLVGFHLLIQESKARNVSVPDTEVDARIAQIKKQFQSEDAFSKRLAQQKMTLEQLREDARSDMQVAKLLQDEISSKVNVDAAAVTDFYQKNPDKFQQGERVRASHILVRVPEKADEKAKAAARTKAEGILKEVKAGQDFGTLAKQNSDDPGSAQNGGDLGYFMHGQMVGAFERAAFSLKPGDVSDLVETPFGFHIIKVADKQPARALPIDEVRPQIEQYLQNQQRQQKTQAFVENLKKKGKIEILI